MDSTADAACYGAGLSAGTRGTNRRVEKPPEPPIQFGRRNLVKLSVARMRYEPSLGEGRRGLNAVHDGRRRVWILVARHEQEWARCDSRDELDRSDRAYIDAAQFEESLCEPGHSETPSSQLGVELIAQ